MRRRMLASIGGMKMPTARDYVQDGLIAMWDGIENAGWGVHDSLSAVWKDLVGNNDLELVTGCSFGKDNISVVKGGYAKGRGLLNPISVEIVFSSSSSSSSSLIFGSNITKTVISGYTRWNRSAYFNGANGVFFFGCEQNGFNSTLTKRSTYTGVWDSSSEYQLLFSAKNAVEQQPDVLGNKFYHNNRNYMMISPRYDSNYAFVGEICSLRFYNHALSSSEITANYAVDKARFGLP